MSDHIAPADRREGLRAAVYYRCSSKQQELSVADQRREVEAFAPRNGYVLVREYVDEGKSASKEQEKRTAFNRMIADSAAGEFEVVLCYDAARFTRFDNIEGSMPKQVLRSNGVILVTVKEGVFDWSATEGRWKDMAFCEANKAASLNISKDSIRGRVNVLKPGLGYWPSGTIPYGFDREYTDGVRVIPVRRHEKFKKGKNWHLRLVVNDAEAAIVREVFDLYVGRQWSRRQIALHLTDRKVPPPQQPSGVSNGVWDEHNVTTVLRTKAYIGVGTIGGKTGRKKAHNKVVPVEQPNACPAVVESHVWHDAQEIARERSKTNCRPHTRRGGVLSSLLWCGHCGYRLNKRTVCGRDKYFCITTRIRPHLGCKTWGVYEDQLLPRVLGWLVEAVEEEVIGRLQAVPPEPGGPASEEALTAAEVETLSVKVKAGTESALLAPPAAREAAWAKVREWQEQLDAATQRLDLIRAVRTAPEFDGFEAWWTGVKEQIVMVETTRYYPGLGGSAKADGLTVGNPSAVFCPIERDRLRALLARLGFRGRVWWGTNADKRDSRHPDFEVSDVQIEAAVPLNNLPAPNRSPCG